MTDYVVPGVFAGAPEIDPLDYVYLRLRGEIATPVNDNDIIRIHNIISNHLMDIATENNLTGGIRVGINIDPENSRKIELYAENEFTQDLVDKMDNFFPDGWDDRVKRMCAV